jgi:hypothetical protein
MSVLQLIQEMQFRDKSVAEDLLLRFLRESFPLDVVTVSLRPLAVSLNSFNGFITLRDGQRLFFKTHTELDGVIAEYYNAAQLAEAGYPVLQPIYSSTEAGKQLLIYEVIDDPSVFDLAWAIENGQSQLLGDLTRAQHAADDQLLAIYRKTLDWQTANNATAAPIHQLFYHRLASGRLARFYGEGDENPVQIMLPDGVVPIRDVRQVYWVINGQEYAQTLDQLISSAIELLNPSQEGPSIVGHGDAHNGNVFYRSKIKSLLYFDPAFAGRHHPLLDLAKPLFHNVFAMWMYFPSEKAAQTNIQVRCNGNDWYVDHDYAIHTVREMFLMSKVERVLIPFLRDLHARGWLREDWRTYLKTALFCCPFLTMNLADAEKFPPTISLLGLSMAIEMGGESERVRSRIDRALDQVEHALYI